MRSFNTIGLVGRIDSDQALATLAHLNTYLTGAGIGVIIESKTANALKKVEKVKIDKSKIHGQEELSENADLIIVVGGDGSLLSASRFAAKHDTPLLGVNRGRLGFLTDINPVDLDSSIQSILSGDYTVEKRFLLEAQTNKDYHSLALNDVVLNSGSGVSMVEFELYVDEHFVYSQSSDGLIISTPTGSTAYALSGGGPIMHPALDAIVLVPMFPHTLSSRPLVVDGNSEIRIVPSLTRAASARISCDAQDNILVKKGSEVIIRKSKYELELLHPTDHDFYQACRSKLHWGTKL